MIKSKISILPGINKENQKESYERIELFLGETIAVVGHTGSGKTSFISDIEQLTQGESNTRRKILIDDRVPSDNERYDAKYKPITMITQNTKCVSDLYVFEFLQIHARARQKFNNNIVQATLDLANQFTGEKIGSGYKVTALSGGQTRALLFADAILIGDSPIILLDEIENAGIYKYEIIKCVKEANKLVMFVTHDPAVILFTERRLVLKNGSVVNDYKTNDHEALIFSDLHQFDLHVAELREKLRNGATV